MAGILTTTVVSPASSSAPSAAGRFGEGDDAEYSRHVPHRVASTQMERVSVLSQVKEYRERVGSLPAREVRVFRPRRGRMAEVL